MITASVYGRLAADPIERATKAGARMATGLLAADVSGRNTTDHETMWINLACFGTAADELLRIPKGVTLNAIGRLTRSHYHKGDEKKESWSLLADSLLTPLTTHPDHRPQR
jgi:single-stranded DNA-binding protein